MDQAVPQPTPSAAPPATPPEPPKDFWRRLEDRFGRRQFLLKAGWGFFWVFLGGWLLSNLRYLFPNVLYEPSLAFKAGKPEDYPIGISTKWKKAKRVWIVREKEGFYAFWARCTHLGCTPNWFDAEGRFKCPCHGSNFNMDGDVIAGPAPKTFTRPARAAGRWMIPVLLAVILIQAFASWAYLDTALRSRAALNYDTEILESKNGETGISNPQAGMDCRTAMADYGRGGIHAAWLLRNFVDHLFLKEQKGNPIGEAKIRRLQYYICTTESYPAEISSLRLLTTGLNARGELAHRFKNTEVRAAVRDYLETWEPRLKAFFVRAPGRTDMAIPYMTWRLTNGDDETVRNLAGRFLARNPGDPIGLWFSGFVLLKNPATAEKGLELLRRSLDLLIEQIMPVPPDLKKMIYESSK